MESRRRIVIYCEVNGEGFLVKWQPDTYYKSGLTYGMGGEHRENPNLKNSFQDVRNSLYIDPRRSDVVLRN